MKYLNKIIIILLLLPSISIANESPWKWLLVIPADNKWSIREGTIIIDADTSILTGYLIEDGKKVATIIGTNNDNDFKLTVDWHSNNGKEQYIGKIYQPLIDPYDYPSNKQPEYKEALYRLFSNKKFLYLKHREKY